MMGHLEGLLQDFLSAEAVVYQKKETVRDQARCWLRTSSGAVLSDFVSRTALANLLLATIRVPAKNPVIALIRSRQIVPDKNRRKRGCAEAEGNVKCRSKRGTVEPNVHYGFQTTMRYRTMVLNENPLIPTASGAF